MVRFTLRKLELKGWKRIYPTLNNQSGLTLEDDDFDEFEAKYKGGDMNTIAENLLVVLKLNIADSLISDLGVAATYIGTLDVSAVLARTQLAKIFEHVSAKLKGDLGEGVAKVICKLISQDVRSDDAHRALLQKAVEGQEESLANASASLADKMNDVAEDDTISHAEKRAAAESLNSAMKFAKVPKGPPAPPPPACCPCKKRPANLAGCCHRTNCPANAVITSSPMTSLPTFTSNVSFTEN